MAEPKLRLEDWLDDLCVRFIINLPEEDLSSVARICFQVEEAQWFYEDFIRPLDPALPSMSLRNFCLRIFQHCPLLANFSIENHMRAFDEFLTYKTRVPVRGAIMLNDTMDSTVLVKGWKKGASWSFPRGKINKDEDDLDCAIREVYEETGLDIKEAGLVPKDEEVKYIQITMREQQVRLYVFRNIPMDINFQPKTRKEISNIKWYPLSTLPAFRKKGNQQYEDEPATGAGARDKFYMVAPFLPSLKKWVLQQKKRDAAAAAGGHQANLLAQPVAEEPLTEDDIGNQTEAALEPASKEETLRTLEATQLELQRLVGEQPATQGVQLIPPQQNRQDPGDALMAMLRGGRSDAVQPAQQAQPQVPAQAGPRPGVNYIPHTPIELIQGQVPPPHTPHHHRPPQHNPPVTSFPPPQFLLAPNYNPNANLATTFFNQNRGPVLAAPHNSAPFPNAFHVHGSQHHTRPVLVHPQPLPPQVQTSRLARDTMTPGNVAQAALKNPSPNGQFGAHVMPSVHGLAGMAGQPRNLPVQPQRQANGQPPPMSGPVLIPGPKPAGAPQLTNQQRALLDVFKAPSAGPVASKPTETYTQSTSLGAQAFVQPQSQLPAELNAVQPMLGTESSSQPYLNGKAQPAPPSQIAPTYLKPVVPNERQAALLGLFREAEQKAEKPDPLSPSGSDVTVKPIKTTTIPLPTTTTTTASRGVENVAPRVLPLSSANPRHTSHVQANGASHQTSATSALPYRAVSILSRPKQGQEPMQQPHPFATAMAAQPSPTVYQDNMVHAANLALQEAKSETRPPAIQQSVPAVAPPYQRTALPGPQANVPMPATTVLQRRQGTNSESERKQNLLSLFGGGSQTSPMGIPAQAVVSPSSGGPALSPADENKQTLLSLLTNKKSASPSGSTPRLQAPPPPPIASSADQNKQNLLSLFTREKSSPAADNSFGSSQSAAPAAGSMNLMDLLRGKAGGS